MDYYDSILAGISGSLVTGASIGFATSIPVNLSLGAGAALSLGFMYHGMFERAPVAQ